MNHLTEILAQAAPPAGQTPPTGLQQLFGNPLIFIILMVVMMYFLLFRPQSQQRKRQEKMLQALKSGDKIVTSSGIIGQVITVKDKTVSLRSADAKMEVTKGSVAEILESSSTTES
ncbi:MAG TPA: preprotein translocase subunit YajC [Verrucomicrobiae bacterium]|nr:preprotein translocase subunit YajC [Verrucomicrobiae bacterium]